MTTVDTQAKSIRHKNIILLIIGLAQLMDVLDTTIVNVAIPTISKNLHIIGVNNLQWLITTYGLTYAGFLFLSGRLADIIGHRKIFMIGVFLFGASSLMAGLSSSSSLLIVWRGIEGLGAAGIAAASLSSIISVYSEGKERNRAMTIWGTLVGGGVALGLVLGGVITQYVGWRWIFFVNVPISAVVLLATPYFVPKLPGQGTFSLKKFDILGAILLTTGLITLVYGLTKAPSYGWGSSRVVEMLATAVILLAAFIFNEIRAKEPLLNLKLFAKGNIAVASVISILVTGSNGAMLFFLAIYNQQVLGYSPAIAGLTLLPVIFIAFAALQIVRKLLDKFGFKPVMIVQLLILAVGLFSLIRLPINGHYLTDELPSLIVIAVGLTASIGLMVAATNGVKEKDSGAISGILNTAQQIGGPLILGILSTIAATYTVSSIIVNNKLNALAHGAHAAFLTSAMLVLLAAFLCAVFVRQTTTTDS
ncbi:MAG TPA: MFS transporter [Verrucomicrobiae bacterium]|nr:MFS transporter [Verrucomicrobiae bacterium]